MCRARVPVQTASVPIYHSETDLRWSHSRCSAARRNQISNPSTPLVSSSVEVHDMYCVGCPVPVEEMRLGYAILTGRHKLPHTPSIHCLTSSCRSVLGAVYLPWFQHHHPDKGLQHAPAEGGQANLHRVASNSSEMADANLITTVSSVRWLTGASAGRKIGQERLIREQRGQKSRVMALHERRGA